MEKPTLENILNFVGLLNKFREVKRVILVKDSDRDENDQEHSYSLAMLAWYVNSTYKLGLDNEKLFKYALAHDLVEIHAGDTFFYHQNEEVVKDKTERELEAATKLDEEFPEFLDMHEAIFNYENKTDREAKFVYALDKVEPVLNIYLDGGRTWKRDEVTIEMLKSMKTPKVAADPIVAEIFAELVQKLESKKEELF